MPSGGLSDTLAHIALKRVLKKTLLDKAETGSDFGLCRPPDFPLVAFFRGRGQLRYRSPIALQQDASETMDPATLAKQWVELLTSQSTVAANDESAIAHYLNINADTHGWITVTLLDPGTAIWLKAWNETSLTHLKTHEQPENSLPLDALSQRPLCKQLKLSLPMLLQFAHASCCHWLRQAEQFRPRMLTSQSILTDASEFAWGWSSQSPAACHVLLQRTVQALDTMAEQQGGSVTCLRQGYTLAEAIYSFQAAVPLATVQTFPDEVQNSIWSTVKAAQQGLALVILGTLKQTPVMSF